MDHRRPSGAVRLRRIAPALMALALACPGTIAQPVFHEVDPSSQVLVRINQILTTPPVWGDTFWCYVANTSQWPVSVLGVMLYDRDGRMRAVDSGPGPTCPSLESSHPPMQLLPHQTCVLQATKSESGSIKTETTVAYCKVSYTPRSVTGVRASITSRHENRPHESTTLPAFPQ